MREPIRQSEHAGISALGGGLCCFELERRAGIGDTACNEAARIVPNRNGFAGERGFIEQGHGCPGDQTVHGNCLSGSDEKDIAGLDVLDGHALQTIARATFCGPGDAAKQRRHFPLGGALGIGFQRLPARIQSGQRRCRRDTRRRQAHFPWPTRQ